MHEPERPDRRAAEPDGLGDARRALAAWTLPDDPDDPADLARAALATRPGPAARRRAPWRSLWVGAAAALLAFLGLALLGARLTRDGDRLSVSLRLPFGAAAADPAPALEARAAAAARRASEEVLLRFGQRSARDLDQREERWRAERLELARALDRALTEERRVFAGWVEALTRGAAREDLRTREAVARLASSIGTEPR